MSIADSIVPGYPEVTAIIEDDSLVRAFAMNLFTPQVWRSEVTEVYPLKPNMGVSETHTRSGRLEVDETPARAGADPVPQNFGVEQWVTKVRPYDGTLDINLTVEEVALDSVFMQRISALGLQAGETINRLPRNALFSAYGTGTSLVDVGVVAGTSFTVSSIAGFTHQIGTDGILAAVSSNNPKRWYLNPTNGSTPESVTIIGATPADPLIPLGRGTLTTSGNTTVSTHDVIKAYDAPVIIRAGGGSSSDSITVANTLKLAHIRRASAILSDNSIPRHADGYYHCHLPSTVNADLFNDSELQAMGDGRFGDAHYRTLMLGILYNCIFFENADVPRDGNVGTLQTSRPTNATSARLAPLIGIEMINRSGVAIMRVVITGGGALCECPTTKFPGGTPELGFAGQMTSFRPIANGGITANTMGIKLILRAPVNRLGDIVSATWAWGGDFGVPSDALGGRRGQNARFKRAVVIECADPQYS